MVNLLLHAALAPEPDARIAWRAWKARRNFDDISWWEKRLLVPLALRLRTLDPDCELLPRIDGLAKYLWTTTQLGLRETATVFDRLTGHGIRFIVFKGAAQYAEGLTAATRRIMGDVDILVHPDQAVAALDSLAADGWTASNGESFELLRRLAGVRLSGNFNKGQYGEVDLHSSPFHFARIDPHLDADLWQRARPASLAMRPILVPDPTDSVLLLLAHSVTSGSGDWALDIAIRIEKQSIDWDRLAQLAARRGLVPACLASLSYLREELGIAVPEAALEKLARTPVTLGERLKYWSNVRDRAERNLAEKAVNRLADRVLRHQRFWLIAKDRRAITVTRPRIPLRWLLGLAAPVSGLPDGAALERGFSLVVETAGRRLVLKIAFLAPAMSRRLFFDVTVNEVGIARLRTRAGGRRAGKETSRTFYLPMPVWTAGKVDVLVSARPVRYIAPDAAAGDLAALSPIPFRISGAFVF